MATKTDKEAPLDEIIEDMLSKLQLIRDNINASGRPHLTFKIRWLSEAIDTVHEEVCPIDDLASKSHNAMQFTLVERPKKHGPYKVKKNRNLKKPIRYKRQTKKGPRQDQVLLPETWLSKPIPLDDGVDLRLDYLRKHSELFRRFFAAHPLDDDDTAELDLYALMGSDYAKEQPGYQAIVDMNAETVIAAFRTWNAWLLRGKIEMGATRETKDNALKLARFLGTTKEFVDAVKAFKPAG